MRLALVTRRFPPLIGGAEKVLSYLSRALAAEGADVTVLTARPRGLPESESIATSAGQLKIVRLRTSRARFVGTWLYMRELDRWFASHPIDLAYVSMLKHDAYVAIGAGRRLGFPVVLRPEGAGATGDLAWQSWGRFGRTIGHRCRSADAIVSISHAITDELVRAGYDLTRIHALPNGVPIPEMAWRPRIDWRSAPRGVFVGRLAPEKGLDILVEAWPKVLAEYPSARLILVGEGPERPSLEARISRLGLGGSVGLPGSVPDPAVELRAADLFVLPSREEGMSIALLEAMALGIPVVATSIPGNRRLVTDSVQGRLVAPDDPGALASAILQQWSNVELAAEMASAARTRVIHDYSIAAVAQRHVVLFRSLIDARSARGGSSR
jgi:glycosyltransferase involved in cell wall biosynthesis